MSTQLENNKVNPLFEIDSFLCKLSKVSTKDEIALILLSALNPVLNAKFSSFIEKEESKLKVVCQLGESDSTQRIQHIFKKELCEQLFEWVVGQERLASLRLVEKELFVFLPLIDHDANNKLVHGMVVLHLGNSNMEFAKDVNITVGILGKLVSQALTKLKKKNYAEKYYELKEQVQSELKLTTKLQMSMSGSETNKKILFNVLEEEGAAFRGNFWWMSDLGDDINVVLIAHVGTCLGMPLKGNNIARSMLVGYILGEMNSLKAKADISLKPYEVLKYLNKELNHVFKSTGISVNAWYGVFNIGARKIRFANANHPDPFLIGPEQQVVNLSAGRKEKGQALGVNLNSTYTESTSFISSGSKLVICTQDLLEHACKVGDKFDPTWLPQVLETIGSLSLSEMKKSLENILSGNGNGTAHKHSRLALLLEIPS